MSILVQREFRVAAEDRREFERQSREGLWPAFLRFGAMMVAYGRWGFSGPGGVAVTHTVYVDFDHWLATRLHQGAFYRDEAMLAEIADLLPVYAERQRLVQESQARLIELDDELSAPRAHYRRPGEPVPDPPPSFGAGSVVSERSYTLVSGSRHEFLRLSREQIWPWLEEQGGRMVAVGSDPMRPSDELITLFAFRSLPDWHRFSRPTADVRPPRPVEDAWQRRHRLVERQSGRLLIVESDFGVTV